MFPRIKAIDRTHVSFGYVDLCQLLWADYSIPFEGKLHIYGYDQAEVSVARSVLIYEMMKRPKTEVSDKTILQIWFSSCWDQDTQREFYSFLDKHVPNINNSLLSKFAPVWEKKRELTVEEAQKAFTDQIQGVHSEALLNLNVRADRVAFARYLFTGCIFVDEGCDPVCGNVTMFPSCDENWCYALIFNVPHGVF